MLWRSEDDPPMKHESTSVRGYSAVVEEGAIADAVGGCREVAMFVCHG